MVLSRWYVVSPVASVHMAVTHFMSVSVSAISSFKTRHSVLSTSRTYSLSEA